MKRHVMAALVAAILPLSAYAQIQLFSSTGDPASATSGFAVALALALLGRSLPVVAAAATAVALLVRFFAP